MPAFSEQFQQARVAKGLTQAQLADALHVARSTVAHWEQGRALPSADAIRRASALLGVEFALPELENGEALPGEMEEALSDGGAPASVDGGASLDSAAPSPSVDGGASLDCAAPSPSPARRFLPRAKWLLLALAVLAAALALVLYVRPVRVDAQSTGEIHPERFYRQAIENLPGRACLSLAPTYYRSEGSEKDYLMCTFHIAEVNGCAFHVKSVQGQAFGDHRTRSILVSAEDLTAVGIASDIAPFGAIDFTGGFPYGSYNRVGIAVYGEDENGKPMTFTGFLDLRY